MDIDTLLRVMVEQEASDLYCTAGAPPSIKVEGSTSPVGARPLDEGRVKQYAYTLMNAEQIHAFERDMELDMGVSVAGVGRFRVNVFRQRGSVSMVVRYLRSVIPSIEALNLPSCLQQLVMEPRGLILVVGATGSGKSTTLAAMLDFRNAHRSGHILTVEDPIEYLHNHKQSIVNQREVGYDTRSYGSALKRAMREAPDVIFIGEVRERETMEHAVTYADTGHLCLSTLHATNAPHTLERVVNFFPAHAHRQVLTDLAFNLNAVVSQRLVPGIDGKRVPAIEILLNTPHIADLIEKGELQGIREAMTQGTEQGMQTFDQSLIRLYRQGKISREAALHYADSRNNVGLNIRLMESAASAHPETLRLDEGVARTDVDINRP